MVYVMRSSVWRVYVWVSDLDGGGEFVYQHRCVCLFQQKTAYEVRIRDWSSDVGASDLFRLSFPTTSYMRHCRRQCPTRSRDCGRRCVRAARTTLFPTTTRLLRTTTGQRRSVTFIPAYRRSEERRVGKECVSKCRSWG